MGEDCGLCKALQYWAKKANLSKLGQPCLLVGLFLELQQKMKKYVQFLEDVVFGSVALPEGFFGNKTSISTEALPASSNVLPEKEAIPVGGSPQESTPPQVPCGKQVKVEVPPNWFPAGRKYYHPSKLVATVGQTPQATGDSMRRHCHQSSEA